MAIAPWLEWLSAAQRRRREKKTREQLLPGGETQRTAELALLRELFPGKTEDKTLLFQLFQARACLNPQESDLTREEREDALLKWQTGSLSRQFTLRERCLFLALADLTRAPSALPMPDAVRARAKELEENPLSVLD